MVNKAKTALLVLLGLKERKVIKVYQVLLDRKATRAQKVQRDRLDQSGHKAIPVLSAHKVCRATRDHKAT
jgi:hypothetical protein